VQLCSLIFALGIVLRALCMCIHVGEGLCEVMFLCAHMFVHFLVTVICCGNVDDGLY
jgi:hypothetical protein